MRDKGTGANCCNDTQNLFSFTPGYIQAVINGDGTNRLGPYIATDGKVVAAPTSTASTGLETSSSSNTSATTIATATATAGDAGGLSTPIRDAVIAIGVVLGVIFLVSLTLLAYVWRKLSRERRLRREGQKLLRRQEKEIRPQLTPQIGFQTDGGGVTGWRSGTYAGEHVASVQELPVVRRVGELST